MLWAKLLSDHESIARGTTTKWISDTLGVCGDRALSNHTAEFGLNPFPKESKDVVFEPRLLLIPSPCQKGEVTRLTVAAVTSRTPNSGAVKQFLPLGPVKFLITDENRTCARIFDAGKL